MNAHQIVEAVLFASDAPLTADEIARADEGLDEDQVEQAIRFLQAEYDDAERSFQIVEIAEGYQVLTRAEFAPYLERFDNVPRPSRLSGPALETLAIIAYRQPIGRIEIEYVRGVGSAGVLKTLQDRELIDVVGRAEGLGRPVLYGTGQKFLEHFGFKSLEDLPRPEELPVILRERIPLGPEELEGAGEEGAEAEQLVLGEEGAAAPPVGGEAAPAAETPADDGGEGAEDDVSSPAPAPDPFVDEEDDAPSAALVSDPFEEEDPTGDEGEDAEDDDDFDDDDEDGEDDFDDDDDEDDDLDDDEDEDDDFDDGDDSDEDSPDDGADPDDDDDDRSPGTPTD